MKESLPDNDEEDIRTHPCANCGGQLRFHIGQQKLVCPHCGHAHTITRIPGAAVEEQSYAALASRPVAGSMQGIEGEKAFVCRNCAASTTFIGTVIAMVCPYCATPIQRTDIHDAPQRLAVDGVLPFSVTHEEAAQRLQQWINKRWFAPNAFKKYSRAGSFKSVYAAYFTYDAQATTDYRGERGEHHTRTIGEGGKQRTETVTHWHAAAGRVVNRFDDVVILANTGFDPRYVSRLEPWPTHQLQPFNGDYLAGHLCRSYDRDAALCFVDARQYMDAVIDHTIRQDIGGHEQRVHTQHSSWTDVTYKHVLLPIWLLTVIYEGKPLQVFMNGTTGEIHGQRPWSLAKIFAAALALVLLVALIIVFHSAAG